MFRKILVPLDGSHLAEQILPHVEALARSQQIEVILLRVPVCAYDTAPGRLGPYRRTLFDEQVEETEEVQSAIGYLKHVQVKLTERGLECFMCIRGTYEAGRGNYPIF